MARQAIPEFLELFRVLRCFVHHADTVLDEGGGLKLTDGRADVANACDFAEADFNFAVLIFDGGFDWSAAVQINLPSVQRGFNCETAVMNVRLDDDRAVSIRQHDDILAGDEFKMAVQQFRQFRFEFVAAHSDIALPERPEIEWRLVGF